MKKYIAYLYQYNIIKILILLKCKIISACAFLSKDYVFTPGTSLHFEIPRRLAPGLKKPAVNIKEIPRNARIKFSFFCKISYFLSIFVIVMILSNAKIPNTIMKLLLIRKLLINTKIIFLFHQSSFTTLLL